MGGEPTPIVYVPYTHSPWAQVRLLVRVADSSAATLRAIEASVWTVEPAIPLSGPFVSLQRMEDVRAAGRLDERVNASLVGAFALMALLLAAVGMYGVVAYAVALGTRAWGIRLALGAAPSRVVGGVLRHVATIAVGGLAAGLALALLGARLAESLLYGVSPVDVPTYLTAGALLLAISIVAGYGPARRAGRLDPAVTLRADP